MIAQLMFSYIFKIFELIPSGGIIKSNIWPRMMSSNQEGQSDPVKFKSLMLTGVSKSPSLILPTNESNSSVNSGFECARIGMEFIPNPTANVPLL